MIAVNAVVDAVIDVVVDTVIVPSFIFLHF